MNPNLKIIRQQIFHPDEIVLPTWGIAHHDDLPDEALGINLIVEPKELRSFFVVFDLVTPLRTKSKWGVLLPGPTKPGLDIYNWLGEHADKPIQQRCIPLPQDLNFIDEPFATYDIWNNWH